MAPLMLHVASTHIGATHRNTYGMNSRVERVPNRPTRNMAGRNVETLLNSSSKSGRRTRKSRFRVSSNQRGNAAVDVQCTLPDSLDKIVSTFKAVPDPMQRYKQLLYYATTLQPLDAAFKVDSNKVKGCVSQVWVVPSVTQDGNVQWMADSDSQLTKGLAALLVQGLSGISPEEIIAIQPEFITELGLQQSLTPSRNNGFLNMFKLMQAKSLELVLENAKTSSGEASNADGSNANKQRLPGQTVPGSVDDSSLTGHGSQLAENATQDVAATTVAESMRRKLEEALEPTLLVIRDESSKHAGHAERMGVAKGTGETHFSMEITSSKFEGLTSIKRHRLVYSILEEEMSKGPVHALSLVTKTTNES